MVLPYILVTYGKEVGGLGLHIDHEVDRKTAFKQKKRKGRQMNDDVPYQPEEDGWKVIRIKLGNRGHYL